MYLDKRNRGYILLEVLILLNIISIFILLNSKIIIENITKAKLYGINNDVLTLSRDENNLINEAIIDINSNEEIYKNLIDKDKVSEVDYLYQYSNDNNLSLKIKEGKIFLIKQNQGGDLYRAMISKLKIKGDREEIIILPTYYQEYNLNF